MAPGKRDEAIAKAARLRSGVGLAGPVNFGAAPFLVAVRETAKQIFPSGVHLDYEADPIPLPNEGISLVRGRTSNSVQWDRLRRVCALSKG
ncbi:hypothetical protein MPLDJ20_150003 [Mesorhizobium plurifarium]|uniref:Uncharacterized protein n=1 Tax=Mesorhizobium plurifarium TaxID=69974 RepID=A0A090EM07_MESPL|nr:hypothetical protein MPLDJ20_150003 [Mesorhizobium plurifarium]